MQFSVENTNDALPSFRIDSQNSDGEFDAAETIENLKLILSAGQGVRNKTLSKNEPQKQIVRPEPAEKGNSKQNSKTTKTSSGQDNIQIKESQSTHIVEHQNEMTECMKEDDLRIRNYFRNQIYDQGFYEIGLIIQQKYASVAEALALRQELIEIKKDQKQQEEDARELKRSLFIYKAKYQKTKAQKQELLAFYKKEKGYQHTQQMIKQSEEYLKVLNQRIVDAKKIDQEKESSQIADADPKKHHIYLDLKEKELQLSRRQVEALKVQCSMQQRLIQARARFNTHVHIKVNPSDQRFGAKQFQILDEPDLGLAKQIVTGDTVSFVDSVQRVGEKKNLQLDICENVLSSQNDIFIGVIGEPKYFDPSFTVLQQVVNELTDLQTRVRDVNLYYRHGTISSSEFRLSISHSYSRFEKSLVKDIYSCFDFTQTNCVQFKLVKKLFGDKFDTSFLTLYLFTSTADFIEQAKLASEASLYRVQDYFPANQMQHFAKDAAFSSLVINLKDGDELEADRTLRYFQLQL